MIDYGTARSFFDDYPRFYEKSQTGSDKVRLSTRYRALIEANAGIMTGKRVLDLASHDGRWSLAALKAGAKHVLGVEARSEWVEEANKNLSLYGIPKSRYRFTHSDALEAMQRLKPGSVDVIVCFGFFYHTMEHMALLASMKRLEPEHLVLDTSISRADPAIIELREEAVLHESTSVAAYDEGSTVLIGWPSRRAIEMMLSHLNFSYTYFDWWKLNIANWAGIDDYRIGERITLVAKNLPT